LRRDKKLGTDNGHNVSGVVLLFAEVYLETLPCVPVGGGGYSLSIMSNVTLPEPVSAQNTSGRGV
jgi:hypothetical protein